MKNFMVFVLFFTFWTGDAICQEKSIIPLEIVRNKTHVTVKVGDTVIPKILLDTGFAFDGLMIYNPDYRDSFDLTGAMEVKIPGAGSGEPATALMMDSSKFSLGNIEMKNQRLLVFTSDTYKGFPSNGLIGYSIFGHYITELNYTDTIMTLHRTDQFSADSSWSQIPIYFKNNKVPWLDGFIVIADGNPVPVSMYIDYASGEAVELLEKPDMNFQLPAKTENVYLGRGLSGDIHGKTGYISKLIIGGYQLQNIKAAIVSAKVRSKQPDADAILGIESLRRFNLIFDYEGKMLYLKPNSQFHEPFD